MLGYRLPLCDVSTHLVSHILKLVKTQFSYYYICAEVLLGQDYLIFLISYNGPLTDQQSVIAFY